MAADESVAASSGEFPGLDIPHGVDRMGGDADLYRLILKKFAETQPRNLADIRVAVAGGELEKARRIVHSFKGVLGNISANELFGLMKDLEVALDGSDRDHARRLMDEIDRKFAVMLDSIARF